MTMAMTMSVGVNLVEKSIVYEVNNLLRLGYRYEHARVKEVGYMLERHEIIERGFRVWLTEGSLQRVRLEVYCPREQKAYEVCEVPIAYLADPSTEVHKPAIEALEARLAALPPLPDDAQFRLIVTTAPGASSVPGWVNSTEKELFGGLKEEINIGDKHGFGHIQGEIHLLLSNWHAKQDKPADDGTN